MCGESLFKQDIPVCFDCNVWLANNHCRGKKCMMLKVIPLYKQADDDKFNGCLACVWIDLPKMIRQKKFLELI